MTTPLPAASPSAFTTIGKRCEAEISLRHRGVRKAAVRGGWDAVLAAQILRVTLRPFEHRRLA